MAEQILTHKMAWPIRFLYFALCLNGALFSSAASVSLTGTHVRLIWTESSDGWTMQLQSADTAGNWQDESVPAGQFGVLYNYTTAAQSKTAVAKAQLGNYLEFLPGDVSSAGSHVTTKRTVDQGTLTANWWIDETRSKELIAVNVTWTPSRAGWHSISSPRIAIIPDADLGWGVVPGYWASNEVESNTDLEYTWVQGVPKEPFVTFEASTTSLVAILSNNKTGTNIAAIAHPSLARDPYPSSSINGQTQWNVGMSLRSRHGSLTPGVHYPILGQTHSQMAAGSTITATFLYAIAPAPESWYDVHKFVHEEVYSIYEYGKRAKDLLSLSDRISRVHDFLVTAASKWHTWDYLNLTMGAESGKLSDVGGMWMMQRLTNDPSMLVERLPYARNFKLGQQDTSGGTFHGAALGEYFKNGQFVSELVWVGSSSPDYVSPMFTTFYTLSDVGNILLFNKTDQLLLDRLELAAKKLLSWQKSDGSFDVGYIRSKPSALKYPDLTDNRATWYGFIPAYRILNDTTYLDAAESGARWFMDHVISTGRWIGVCDDSQLYPDFATAHAAQALLDLYELTHKEEYLDASISAAKFYTLHIYNHPMATSDLKTRGSETLQDWQLSQVAMNYEHAGFTGSVNNNGPITLASHAGYFLRMYEATNDTLFRDLARFGARGRDAFVDPRSSISSYYWMSGNTGGSNYPWHGEWHYAWIKDYLISSAHLMSSGQIEFPHGFITAKVGSHVPYGFAPGKVYGKAANLWQPRNLVSISDPEVDYFTATSTDGAELYIIMISNSMEDKTVSLQLEPRELHPFKVASWCKTSTFAGSFKRSGSNSWNVDIASNGLAVLSIRTTLHNDPQGPSFRNFSISGDATNPTVSWSFWTVVESWAEWALPSSSHWTSMGSRTSYTFSSTLNLTGIDTESVMIRITSKGEHATGHSSPIRWNL